MLFSRFIKNETGNIAVVSALMLSGLIAVIAFSVNLSLLQGRDANLQNVADAAALAAARELAVAKPTNERIQSVAQSYVNANLPDLNASTMAMLEDNNTSVRVTVFAEVAELFGSKKKNLSATAVAEVSGGGNVCLIGLSDFELATVDLKQRARITAENCQVYSNSSSRFSMVVKDRAMVKMDLVCINGGLKGDPAKIDGEVVTDCAKINDPLRDRPTPKFDLSDCVDGVLDGIKIKPRQKVTLEPGVYCGGLTVIGGEVKFKPGNYVILNGPLLVQSGGSIQGEKVGFYLSGALSTIKFGYKSSIDLSAPEMGELAGLLFFEERKQLPLPKMHRITSKNASRLVGTIYMPRSTLVIDGNDPVASESEYTIIVANKFKLFNGPNLVINTDYDLSTVPVPSGVGMMDVSIRLKE